MRLTMLVLAVLVGGCASVRPTVQPGSWDRHPDSGPLRVYGAELTSPGQEVFQSLLRQPSLEAVLSREGVPDTLEVVGSRYKPKQILLTYTRRGAGPPRRIVLDAGDKGFVARAPEPCATPTPAPRRVRAPAQPRKTREPAAVRENEPSAERTPTARQQLECPIDGARADCKALCKPGASYEWCR